MITQYSRKRSGGSARASAPLPESQTSFAGFDFEQEDESQKSTVSSISTTTSSLSRSKSTASTTSLSQKSSVVRTGSATGKLVRSRSRCVDSGTNQEILDDLEYQLDSASAPQSNSVRLHSARSLLELCQQSDTLFIMRAHGMVDKLCTALSKPPTDPIAHVTLATVAFLIARDDSTGSDIASAIIPGLVPLIRMDQPITDAKINDALSMCGELPRPCPPRNLAMMVLARSADTSEGRVHLRQHGVLSEAAESLVGEARKKGRMDLWWTRECLTMVEHGIVESAENQDQAIEANLVPACLDIVSACLDLFMKNQRLPMDTLLAGLRTVMNLTNNSAKAAKSAGVEGITLMLRVVATPLITDRFDVVLLSSGAAVNIIESAPDVAVGLLDAEVKVKKKESVNSLQFLVNLFMSSGQQAVAEDTSAPDESSQISKRPKASLESTDTQILDLMSEDSQPASGALENSVLSAYIALLLGCLARCNIRVREDIRRRLPDQSFEGMKQMIVAFLHLHGRAGLLPEEALQTFEDVARALD